MGFVDDILAVYSSNLNAGDTTPLDARLESSDPITLCDEDLPLVRQFLDRFSVHVQETVRASLFEAHLRKFGYTNDRVTEYARIDRLYHGTTVQ